MRWKSKEVQVHILGGVFSFFNIVTTHITLIKNRMQKNTYLRSFLYGLKMTALFRVNSISSARNLVALNRK